MSAEAVDLSAELGPVRDQGNRGTCLAFATTAAHEAARVRRRGHRREPLSEELLYWACKQVDGDHDPGTWPESATQALRDTGQPPAAAWPYDGDRSDSDGAYQPPPHVLSTGALRHARLEPLAVDLGALQDALRHGYVVVLAIELWDAFYDAELDVLSSPNPSDLLGDGHAIALVGFDERDHTLLLRNSWGPDEWGNGGHGRLAANALRIVCFGAWRVHDDIDPVPAP